MEAFRVKFSGVRGTNMVTVQPSGVSGGFYAAAPERQPHVTRAFPARSARRLAASRANSLRSDSALCGGS